MTSAADAAKASTIFARLHPSTYLARFLGNGIRPDGRSFDQARTASVAQSTISTADGSCLVRLGNTIVVAGVKAELMELLADELDDRDDDEDDDKERGADGQASPLLEGIGPVDRRRLIVGLELSPMSSPRFKPGPPGEEAQVLVNRLMRALDASPPFSASSLVETEQGVSWCLFVDIVCIAYDGNVLDACMLAINAALRNTSLPSLGRDNYGALTATTHSQDHTLHPLPLRACPLSFSFAVVDNVHLLSDPNAFEASMTTAAITLTLDAKRQTLVEVHCSGLCSAFITSQEASSADVQGTDEPDLDGVRVQDEELIKVCLARAQKQCSAFMQALTNAQTPL